LNKNVNINNFNRNDRNNFVNWQHNVDHRHGVKYNNAEVRQKYAKTDVKASRCSIPAAIGRARQTVTGLAGAIDRASRIVTGRVAAIATDPEPVIATDQVVAVVTEPASR